MFTNKRLLNQTQRTFIVQLESCFWPPTNKSPRITFLSALSLWWVSASCWEKKCLCLWVSDRLIANCHQLGANDILYVTVIVSNQNTVGLSELMGWKWFAAVGQSFWELWLIEIDQHNKSASHIKRNNKIRQPNELSRAINWCYM